MALSNDIMEMMRADAREKRYPITVNLELLPVCNLDCKMCYIHTSRESVEKQGGLKTVEEWLALAEEMQQADTLFVLLTGGEVFLYPGFRELYEKLYDMGFILTINTNATMITEEVADWLGERPPKCVSISLYDSSDAVYQRVCGVDGMFTRVDRAIRLLRERAVRVECKTVLTPLNKDDLENLWKYVKENDIFYETAIYSFPPVRRTDEFEQIRLNPVECVETMISESRLLNTEDVVLEQMRSTLQKVESTRKLPASDIYGLNCSASQNSCWVNWKGEMIACAMLPEPVARPFETGFAAAWEELKEKCDCLHMSPKCGACENREVCGVCPASNYTETGSFEKASHFHCAMTEYKLRRYAAIIEEETAEEEKNR